MAFRHGHGRSAAFACFRLSGFEEALKLTMVGTTKMPDTRVAIHAP